jgi:lipopolysaccharide/colanic/teichoic acid biosynthesis glycosyltransferase
MFKNIVDRSLAALALCVLSPLLLALACLVRLRMGKPVLFRQTRIGFMDKPFTILKFRTMTNVRDPRGKLMPDTFRLTRLGRIMRAWSLDELPQLWNVLRGDMALVGPRPLLQEFLPRRHVHRRKRHHVKPGITGWAQVNGRNALSLEAKLSHDVWYIDHRSLWLDVRILCLTVFKVYQKEGIGQDASATGTEFAGDNKLAESHGPVSFHEDGPVPWTDTVVRRIKPEFNSRFGA